jgi:hypothetical protein
MSSALYFCVRFCVYFALFLFFSFLFFSFFLSSSQTSRHRTVSAADSLSISTPQFRARYQINSIPISYTLVFDTQPVAGYMFFVPEAGTTRTLILDSSAFSGSVGVPSSISFNLDAQNPSASPFVSSGATVDQGQHVLQIGIRFTANGPLTNFSGSPFTIDGETSAPVLVSPSASNNVLRNTEVSCAFQITENADVASLRLRLFNDQNDFTLTLSYSLLYVGLTYTTRFLITDPTASSTVSDISPPGATIPEGVYTFEFSYGDSVGNTAASASYSPVTIDTFTQPPSLIGWTSNGLYGNPITIQYNLPEPPVGGSVLIAYADSVVADALTRTQVFVDDQSMTYVWDRTTLAVNPPVVQNAGLDLGLPDGTYNITLQYSDAAGNDLASDSAVFVTFDSVTNTPVLNSVSHSGSTITVAFTLAELANNDQVAIILNNNVQALSRTLLVNVPQPYTAGSVISVQFSSSDPRSSAQVVSMTPLSANSISDSTYSVQVQYSDRVPNPSATSNAGTLLVDSVTLVPTLTSPAASTTYKSPFSLTFNLGETPSPNSVNVKFTRNNVLENTLTLPVTVSGQSTFSIDTSNVNQNGVSGTASTIPADTYVVELSYQDVKGNSPSSVQSSGVVIDLATQAPQLVSPTAGTYTSTFTVNYTLPEEPLVGSALLRFSGSAATYDMTLTGVGLGFGASVAFTFDPKDPTSAAAIQSISGGATVVDGQYSVSIIYSDAVGNTAQSSSPVDIVVDQTTEPISLSAPVQGSSWGGATGLTVSYSLPETPAAGTVFIKLYDDVGTLVSTLTMSDSLAVFLTLNDPSNIAVGGGVVAVSATSLPSGVYLASFEYQDAANNEAAVSFVDSITVDAETLQPSLQTPSTGVSLGRIFTVQFSLPESPQAGSVQVQFSGSQSVTLTLTTSTAGNVMFDIDTQDPASSSVVQSSTGSIPSGTYQVTVSYIDAIGNSRATSVAASGVVVDATNAGATLVQPASLETMGRDFTLRYSLAEVAAAGTVVATFTYVSSGATSTVTMATAGESANTVHSIEWDFVSQAPSGSIVSSSSNFPPATGSGLYNISLTYTDQGANAATTLSYFVNIDVATQDPTLTKPTSQSYKLLQVEFNLPETPLAGSVALLFSGAQTMNLTLRTSTAGTHSFNIDPKAPRSSSNVDVISPGPSDSVLADGTYQVRLIYQDAAGNFPKIVSVSSVVIDTSTQAPILIAPTNAAVSAVVNLTFALPEAPQASSVKAQFVSSSSGLTVLTLTLAGAQGDNTINWDPKAQAPSAASGVSSAVPDQAFADGTYSVILSYQDSLGNDVASVTATGVQYDTSTQPPVLSSPLANTRYKDPISLSVTIPEAPTSNSAKLVFTDEGNSAVITYTLGSAFAAGGTAAVAWASTSATLSTEHATFASGVVGGPTLTSGRTYTVQLQYQDQFGNSAASVAASGVSIDSATLQTNLVQPSATAGSNTLPVQYTLAEDAQPGSVKLIFTPSAGNAITLIMAGSSSSAQVSFTLDPRNPTADAQVVSSSSSIIADETYSVTLEYRDAIGNDAVSSNAVSGVVVDTQTQTPTLTAPATSSLNKNPLSIQYTLPETPAGGLDAPTLTFTPTSSGTAAILTMSTATTLSYSFATTDTPVDNVNVIALAPTGPDGNGRFIADGVYTVTLSYADAAGNARATATVSNVVIDTTTLLPTLLVLNNAGATRSLALSMTLPEAPQSGTAKLKFVTQGTPRSSDPTLTLKDTALSSSLSWAVDTDPVLQHPNVFVSRDPAVGATVLPDGTYNVTLQYEDAVGNTVATSDIVVVVIDLTTQTPTLLKPAPRDLPYSESLNVSYTLPETPLSGSVKLLFSGTTAENTQGVSLTLVMADSTSVDFSLDVGALTASSNVVATEPADITGLADGSYSVTLSYQDSLGNAAASSTVLRGIVTDVGTVAPTIVTPASSTSYNGQIPVSLNFPELPLDGNAMLSWTGPSTFTWGLNASRSGALAFTWDISTDPTVAHGELVQSMTNKPSSAPFLQDGTYVLVLTYQDSARSPASSSSNSLVVIDSVTQTPTLTKPEAGVTYTSSVLLSYTLPETPKSGTVTVTFTSVATNAVVLVLTMSDSVNVNVQWDPNTDASGLSDVVSASASTLPSATYTVTLSYRDQLDNAAATTSSVQFFIDTVTLAPQLSSPDGGDTYNSGMLLSYKLDEESLANSVQLILVDSYNDNTHILTLPDATSQNVGIYQTYAISPEAALPAGISVDNSDGEIKQGRYDITLRYQDSKGNAAATVTSSDVLLVATSEANYRTTITLESDYTALIAANGGASSPAVEDATKAKIFDLLFSDFEKAGVSKSRFRGLSLSPGSVIAIFDILPATRSAQSAALDVYGQLLIALRDGSGILANPALVNLTDSYSSVSGLPSEAVCFNTLQVAIPCGTTESDDELVKILLLSLCGAIILITALCFRRVHRADRAERAAEKAQAAAAQPEEDLSDVNWTKTVRVWDKDGDGRLDAEELAAMASAPRGERFVHDGHTAATATADPRFTDGGDGVHDGKTQGSEAEMVAIHTQAEHTGDSSD